MYQITISKTFFNLGSPLSKGLISGLKKLSQRKFIINVDDFNLTDKSFQKILKLEGIEINKKVKEKPEKIFFISAEKNDKKYAIFVSANGKIKSFEEAVNEIIKRLRSAEHQRNTKETEIKIYVELDGKGESEIKSGIGFFDHMLEQIARHSNINLKINVKGDLHIDEHHTVEDVGITLGEALSKALGDKKGIKRYGFLLPMDDANARCAVDLGGRSYLNFKCKFEREKVGDFPTELTEEFFRGLASGLKANIFIRAKGKNDHHKIEAIFKSFAKALNEACRLDERSEGLLPTTKGVL